MKTTGIIRRMDNLGRVVIPKEIRKHIGIEKGDPLEILVSKDEIVLRKYDTAIGLAEFVRKLNDKFWNVRKDMDAEMANKIYEHINALQDILKNIDSG